LEAVGRGDGVRVVLLTARPQVERVLEYVVNGDTVQLNDPAFMEELRRWIGFSDAEAAAKRDGLFSRASGNPSVPRWLGLQELRRNEIVYSRWKRTCEVVLLEAHALRDAQQRGLRGTAYESRR